VCSQAKTSGVATAIRVGVAWEQGEREGLLIGSAWVGSGSVPGRTSNWLGLIILALGRARFVGVGLNSIRLSPVRFLKAS